MSVLKIPLQVFNHYFGPLQWIAGQHANAPTVPYTTSQVGSFQYQPNGQWQRANWDGTAWIPSAGNNATGEVRTSLDNARADMLARTAADQAAVAWAVNQALIISVPINTWQISPTVNTSTTSALNWVEPRRDPLVLDLDGNGITTSGINPAAPILFDQDGDGTLTATGWIASGEAIVVRDLNGNGRIDSGRELFGDNTVLTRGPNVGQLASNGFTALADLDANAAGVADGKFDASDVAALRAPQQSVFQMPYSPSFQKSGWHCAESGFSRRARRHQYRREPC